LESTEGKKGGGHPNLDTRFKGDRTGKISVFLLNLHGAGENGDSNHSKAPGREKSVEDKGCAIQVKKEVSWFFLITRKKGSCYFKKWE